MARKRQTTPALSPEVGHPLDVVERVAQAREWQYERPEDGSEVNLIVSAQRTDYQVSYTWMKDIEALHLACAFDLKIPERKLQDIRSLAALINERLWIGHFDIWFKEGLIMFRYGLILSGSEVTEMQILSIVEAALETSERYYPAFQFVLWANKHPQEALEAAAFETHGNA